MIYSPLEQFLVSEKLLLLLLILSIYFIIHLLKLNILYNAFYDTVDNFLSKDLKEYLPLSMGIFMFIFISNLLGLIPYSYSITCELILSLTMSLTILLSVTIIGFKFKGLEYLAHFLPHGTPIGLGPFLILIEFVSYIAKGLSLGIRLAGNLISGHILLHLIGSSILGIAPLILLFGLELIICFLQSYVFTILFTIYLKESIKD